MQDCSVEDEIQMKDADGAAPRGDSCARIANTRFADTSAEKFPRYIRIVRPSDYQAIYKSGYKIYSSHFVLFGCGNDLGYSRLGITASRKVGGAVERNRAKRLFREIFRRSFHLIPARFDMVVNPKSNYGSACYEELRLEFLTAVKKLPARHSE